MDENEVPFYVPHGRKVVLYIAQFNCSIAVQSLPNGQLILSIGNRCFLVLSGQIFKSTKKITPH